MIYGIVVLYGFDFNIEWWVIYGGWYGDQFDVLVIFLGKVCFWYFDKILVVFINYLELGFYVWDIGQFDCEECIFWYVF